MQSGEWKKRGGARKDFSNFVISTIFDQKNDLSNDLKIILYIRLMVF